MYNAVLYLICVMVWGSSWFAIKFQVGEVPAVQTVFYRFALAAFIMFVLLFLTKTPRRYAFKEHAGFLALGVCMFSINYLLFYISIGYGLTTGLEAVIFSLLPLGNIINARLVYKDRMTPSILSGALVGITGIILIFSSELGALFTQPRILRGVALSLVATYIASLGNMAARHLHARHINSMASTAWGMTYGAIILCVIAFVTTPHFRFSTSPSFLISYAYLTVFASVIAFWAYMSLLGRIGASRTAYAAILFPVMALVLSSIFEHYQWTGWAMVGVLLVVLGNMIVMGKLRLK